MEKDVKSELRSFYLIARFTFFEILRSRVFGAAFFIGLGILLISLIASELSLGLAERVVLDTSLGIIHLTLIVISISFGVSLITKELESKSIHMTLTRPLSRSTFLLGKVLGLSLILALISLMITSQVSFLHYSLFDSFFPKLFLEAIFFMLLESMVILCFSVLCSLFANKVLSVTITGAVLILGHSVSRLLELKAIGQYIWLKEFLSLYERFFLELEKFNLKNYVLYEVSIGQDQLMISAMHGGVYLFILTLLACLCFEKKELQ